MPSFGFGKVGQTILLLAVLSLGASAYIGLKRYLPKNKYDLRELQRVHDRQILADLDEHDVSSQPDTVICPHCGSDYPVRFPVCKNCGRGPGPY